MAIKAHIAFMGAYYRYKPMNIRTLTGKCFQNYIGHLGIMHTMPTLLHIRHITWHNDHQVIIWLNEV